MDYITSLDDLSPSLQELRRRSPNDLHTQKKELGTLNEEEMIALDVWREKLLSPPVLALPKRKEQFTADTDAGDRQVGCVLLHRQEDVSGRHARYFSRTLSEPEMNLGTTHREILAISWTALLLRPYFKGMKLIIRPDYHALRWVLNLADPTEKLARWRLRLVDFSLWSQW